MLFLHAEHAKKQSDQENAMKLIFCEECHDIVKLTMRKRHCRCRKSWGRYQDEENAIIGGEAKPMGIGNETFGEAHRGEAIANRFTAFFIDLPCPTVFKEDRKDG